MRGGNVADGPTLTALVAEAIEAGIPRFDAELLVARAAGLNRAGLHAHGHRTLAGDGLESLRARLRRRSAGEPLAYIEGRREFWSLEFEVSPAVLVPRPETERLVELTLEKLPSAPQSVADLGTGSGAIAIALAHERPRWQVTATDVSAGALAVARRNAQRLGLTRIEFLHGAWFGPIAGRRFDALVSNPPYVADGDPVLAQLSHEPRSALVASDEGYADLLALVRHAPSFLVEGGWLLLEHGAAQGERVAAALVTRGFRRVVCLPDLAGRDRVCCAQWP
jgi:release factor glutamine methyltransferase